MASTLLTPPDQHAFSVQHLSEHTPQADLPSPAAIPCHPLTATLTHRHEGLTLAALQGAPSNRPRVVGDVPLLEDPANVAAVIDALHRVLRRD